MTTTPSAKAEVIPWKTMTPFQRNVLIAEKIMEHRIVKDVWLYWLMERPDRPGLTEEIPHYSEDLNAAFEMLCHFIDTRSNVEQAYFFAKLGRVDEIGQVTILWTTLRDLTADSLCVAALRAMGYEVAQ
jgi:hypothetical protein